jgi:putative SOS response-associated peptidase YedK
MCAQYDPPNDDIFWVEFQFPTRPAGWIMKRVMPYSPAPVLVADPSGIRGEMMSFSLVPTWSKEPKVKFATHNARIETITEKPAFKDAFKKRHCIVPMSGFIEPIYLHELAGNMVNFKSKETMFAVGIWEEWVNPKDGEIFNSFTILTSEPLPFVQKIGHDRSPIFLERSQIETWLRSENEMPNDLQKYLLDNRFQPDFYTTIDRPMAQGWQKRIPT